MVIFNLMSIFIFYMIYFTFIGNIEIEGDEYAKSRRKNDERFRS